MTKRNALPFILIALTSGLFWVCKPIATPRESIRILPDSIFINLYEHGNSKDVPFIFFFYDVQNITGHSVEVNVRRFRLDKKIGNDKCYSVYKNDTLELFGGNITPSQFVVGPKERRRIDLNLDASHLMDLLEKYKTQNNSDQEILRDIAKNSVNYFNWGGAKISISNFNQKIVFRDPTDSAIMEWK